MPILAKLSIYVVDGGQGLFANPVDWMDGLLTVGAIYVQSVADMVAKVLGRVGTSKIQNLFIGGHGAPGWQAVGCGTAGDSTGAKSLQVDPVTKALRGGADVQLRKLAPKFTNDAILTLGGCLVGRDPNLMMAISAALGGLAVQAGTANQRPLVPGIDGHVIRCSGKATSCVDLGRSWWGSPGSWIQ